MTFEQIFKEAVEEALAPIKKDLEELKRTTHLNKYDPVLTVDEVMKFLKIGRTKASELLSRPDFPVIRACGVKVPTHLLIQWIELNTDWVKTNTNYFEQAAI
ncbi:DNA-binding protein [Priestia aryabhattai]